MKNVACEISKTRRKDEARGSLHLGNAVKYSTTVKSVFILLAIVICGRCTKEYNPFIDPRNARAVIRYQSFQDGDTIGIFTTDTIMISAAVGALIDSITVRTPDNRYFGSDTTLYPSSATLPLNAPYMITISFYTSGKKDIVVTTYRDRNEIIDTAMNVFVYSPLSQDTIRGLLGDTIRLHTPPVTDNDVLYNWQLGGATHVQGPHPETVVVVKAPGSGNEGYVWVSDIFGRHRSGKKVFYYYLDDKSGPDIIGIHGPGDTIYTADTRFTFRVSITDPGSGLVTRAMQNGKPFETIDGNVYSTVVSGINKEKHPVAVNVRAWDNYANYSERSFFIKYDSSVISTYPIFDIRIPSKPHTIVNQNQLMLFGYILQGIVNVDTMLVHVSLNGSRYPAPAANIHDDQRKWEWRLELDSVHNRITIAAYDKAHRLLDDTTLFVMYDPDAPDTTSPAILDVLIDGSRTLETDDSLATMQVIAIDEESGIALLTVDGRALQVHSSAKWYYWSAEVRLQHTRAGNLFTIQAYDSAGNPPASKNVFILYNNPPIIMRNPISPQTVYSGEVYRETLHIHDHDRDSLLITKYDGPGGLVVDTKGKIYWNIPFGMSGSDTVRITFTDNIAEPQMVEWVLEIMDRADVRDRVQFAITESDFPSFLEAGFDTLRIRLAVAGQTGTLPFEYKAWFGENDTLTLAGDTLQWIPQLSDTGLHQLKVQVTDRLQKKDVLYSVLRVLPENRPCTISLATQPEFLHQDTLDLRCSAEPETLQFTIKDPDNKEYEHHTWNVAASQYRTIGTLDSTDEIHVIIDPERLRGDKDSVVVYVSDRRGHRDSVKVLVLAGKYTISGLHAPGPLPKGTVVRNSVTFSWSIDGVPEEYKSGIMYKLFLGQGTAREIITQGTGMPEYRYSPLAFGTTYTWQVVASDCRSTFRGPVWEFSTVDPITKTHGFKVIVSVPMVIENDNWIVNSGTTWYRSFILRDFRERDFSEKTVMQCGEQITYSLDRNFTDSTHVDSLFEEFGWNIFADKVENGPGDHYLAYGMSHRFNVPVDGDYEFRMDASDNCFLFIDGRMAGLDDPQNMSDTLYAKNCKTPSATFSKDWTNTIYLQRGYHTMEFLFWEHSSSCYARLYWKKPGDQNEAPIGRQYFR